MIFISSNSIYFKLKNHRRALTKLNMYFKNYFNDTLQKISVTYYTHVYFCIKDLIKKYCIVSSCYKYDPLILEIDRNTARGPRGTVCGVPLSFPV